MSLVTLGFFRFAYFMFTFIMHMITCSGIKCVPFNHLYLFLNICEHMKIILTMHDDVQKLSHHEML